MTPEQAFLLAIIASPADNFPRLAYSDWLEEQGQVERAEFIRVQVELDGQECLCGRGPNSTLTNCCRICDLRRREKELWEQKASGGWVVPDPIHQPAHILIDQNTMAGEPNPGLPTLIFRRGFADEFRGTLATWRQHGPAIVQVQPVEVVRLTGFCPFESIIHDDQPESADWFIGEDIVTGVTPWIVPEFIFKLLNNGVEKDQFNWWSWRREYQIDSPGIEDMVQARDAALADLSRACLLWAHNNDPATPALSDAIPG